MKYLLDGVVFINLGWDTNYGRQHRTRFHFEYVTKEIRGFRVKYYLNKKEHLFHFT